jgi:hypothetical protein
LSKQVSRLEGGLIVRKGQAAPAIASAPAVVASPPPTAPPEVASSTAPPPKGIAGTIAVTVRLDPERYERLKMHGARRRRTNQQIIVAALDAYLGNAGAEESR